ncbi:ferric reductase like transmembrane component-domain-containing protein [Boletus edulis BED1]|uniref:ferric-chelate reductase (NADPH) n=1 Tax=Boletus edulis BED1 TaxID=1328754 RepID=A0AAD4GI66_BOLED|nr:ferric reductase like transmembrane component-domain-containing protein [Boletus edulis BED1]
MELEGLTSLSLSGPPVSDSTLVYRLDIFILIIILAFTSFNVPRVLVYIANNRSEVYLLRSATGSRMVRSASSTTLQPKEKVPLHYPLPELQSAAGFKKQWHFPMCLSLRHPAASFIHYRVLGNYTVVQAVLMAGYTAAVFYAAFYESNPFSYPKRAGWVTASQIPFVYALATKNNVIGLLVGVGYEKLNYLHRHLGRLMVIGANVHAIGYIYEWTIAGVILQRLDEPFIRWGLVALVCFDLLGFFSVHCVRTKSYNLFFGTHFVGLILALFAACYHKDACVPFVIGGAVVYGVDHGIRTIKTCFTTAAIQTIPEMGLTRVDIPSLRTGWRAGQHVRLRVLSTAMGLWGMIEVHPFTIASATNTEEGLVLMCKRTGSWTNRLYNMARTTESSEHSQEPVKRVKVMVEGPYGGVGDTTIPNYSGAMFVAGGSGVTFALSALQDLVLAGDRSRTKVIELIWSIQDPAALDQFIPLFATLVSQSSPAAVRISVFYTRATTASFEKLVLPPGITLTPGRPNIERLLDELAVSITNKGGTHGAFIGVCGAAGLGKDVARAVRMIDVNSKKAVGGIQFHEEVFGW